MESSRYNVVRNVKFFTIHFQAELAGSLCRYISRKMIYSNAYNKLLEILTNIQRRIASSVIGVRCQFILHIYLST